MKAANDYVNFTRICRHCGGPAKLRFCDFACYTAWRRAQPFEPRFWAKVQKTPTCWLWTSNRVPGWHGMFFLHGRPQYAHRLSWELHHGPIPDGLQVLHHCDVPHCVNPAHLFLGTQDDNLKDAASKGRLSVTRPRGHKVSTDDLVLVDQLLAAGELHIRIAEQFGVSRTWVHLYARGKRRQYDRPQPQREERAS